VIIRLETLAAFTVLNPLQAVMFYGIDNLLRSLGSDEASND